MTQRDDYSTTPAVGIATTEVSIGERLRWGPVVAGLFVALSTLIVLSVLGWAVGMTAWDTATGQGWVVGAGIWGAIAMIIAFLIGGWLAAKWSGSVTPGTAALHGLLVWAVAVPLFLFVLGGIGAMMGPAVMEPQRTVGVDVMNGARPAGAMVGEGVTPAETGAALVRDEQVGAAWGTFIALLLGLGAATLGGYLGSANVGGYRTHRPTTPGANPPTN